MQRRRLIVTLPRDVFRILEALAEREERATDQQASLLLKRLLRLKGGTPERPRRTRGQEVRR